MYMYVYTYVYLCILCTHMYSPQDQDVMIRRKEKDTQDYRRKLKTLFDSMDSSGDGCLGYDEFCHMLANKDCCVCLCLCLLFLNILSIYLYLLYCLFLRNARQSGLLFVCMFVIWYSLSMFWLLLLFYCLRDACRSGRHSLAVRRSLYTLGR